MGRDRFEAEGSQYPTGQFAPNGRPGIGAEGSEWIGDRDVSVVCWDFHDALASKPRMLEVHMLIWAVGLCLVDNSNLGPAAEQMHAAGVSTGLLSAAPLAIHRATGTLVHPLLLY
jgi:hypothetical protein